MRERPSARTEVRSAFATAPEVGPTRVGRRALLRPRRPGRVVAPPAQDDPLTAGGYGQLVSMVREGRFVETARRAGSRRPAELREAQRAYLETLPPAADPEGFRTRLAAALMHAETVVHFGWSAAVDFRLLRAPVDQLSREWAAGMVPDAVREEAVAGWGEAAASDARRLIWRELVLTVARLRLARLDLLAASRTLEAAEPLQDAAIGWQLAVVWSVRARYVREDELWADVEELFREAAAVQLVDREAARKSHRTVARLLGDPDDRNLRLALVALGRNRRQQAEALLTEVREQPAPLLRAPRLMLLAETQLAGNRMAQAVASLEEAAELAPSSHAVIAALVAALEVRGRWDEAAALAADQLAREEGERVWMDFLITWATTREPSLDWLRGLVRT